MNFKYHEVIFDWVFYIIYFLYLTTYFGVMYLHNINHKEIIEILNQFMTYYISFFLIIRFNPFSKNKFTNFDKKIAFNAGLFLITTTALGNYATKMRFLEEGGEYLYDISNITKTVETIKR